MLQPLLVIGFIEHMSAISLLPNIDKAIETKVEVGFEIIDQVDGGAF